MCGRITQSGVERTRREQSQLLVIDHNSVPVEVNWLGLSRREKDVHLPRVEIRNITNIEHHGDILTFSEPVTLQGIMRPMPGKSLIPTGMGLWVLTQDAVVLGVKDRWPVMASPSWEDFEFTEYARGQIFARRKKS